MNNIPPVPHSVFIKKSKFVFNFFIVDSRERISYVFSVTVIRYLWTYVHDESFKTKTKLQVSHPPFFS